MAVVTDVSLFREGLTTALSQRRDLEVLGGVSPTPDGIEQAVAIGPEVVLVDASTVRASELIRHFTDVLPGARTVAFAVAEDNEREVLACAEAGAAGFVSRAGTLDELVAAVHAAARGEVRCPPRVAALVFRRLTRLAVLDGLNGDQRPLTSREAEIAALLERGCSNKEIAAQLGIEVATVKNHVHSILEKLRVRRRGEAVAIVRSWRDWSSRTPPPELDREI